MELSARFDEALLYATHLHSEQKRKGTNIPYVSHLLGVASLVMEDDGDEDEVISALLHDAVEDQGGRKTLDQIRGKFGDRVAEIVEGCTDSFRFPKITWTSRKQEHLKKLVYASSEVIKVSLADKLYNARSLTRDLRFTGDNVWRRFHCSPDQMRWYYCQLVIIFEERSTSPNVFELSQVVKELSALINESI